MNSFTEKIKKGREKGITLRRNKFYRKATRHYEKFNTESTESCKKIESAWRWVKAAAVLIILTLVYNTYSAQKYYSLLGELNVEYEELINMQAEANELYDNTVKLIELVDENRKLADENDKLDEQIMDLIERKLDEIKPKPKPKEPQEHLLSVL